MTPLWLMNASPRHEKKWRNLATVRAIRSYLNQKPKARNATVLISYLKSTTKQAA